METDAKSALFHTLRGDHREYDVHDTLQRVVPEESNTGFEVIGELGTLEIGGFWSRHIPKTPPFVVPLRNHSHVHDSLIQHNLNLKLSGTEQETFN